MTDVVEDPEDALIRPRGRAALLRCLGLVLGVVEELAGDARDVGDAAATALTAVEAELRSLVRTPEDSHRGLERALAHVAELQREAATDPLILLGTFQATAKAVQRDTGLSVPAVGRPLDAEDRTVVAAAAQRTAAALEEVREAIRAESSSRSRPVHALNTEAGNHVVTTEPQLLLAALAAGERSWAAWPYFAQRYGERGRRFTRSDSAWLVTLATRDRDVVAGQIDWLAEVLAVRGMPRILLTDHLRNLHEALVGRVPERSGDFGFMLEEADRLDRDAEAAVDAATTGRWTARLRDVEPEGLQAARLVVAAAADHCSGLPEVLDAVVGWFSDADRFGSGWVSAVGTVAAEARAVRN